MFTRLLKWIGVIIAGLAVLVLIGLSAIYLISQDKLNKVYTIPPTGLVIPSDIASIERGKHLVTVFGQCQTCHQDDFSGKVEDEGLLVGRIVFPNLTSGKGGIGSQYTDEDWVLAIRHGVKPDGKGGIVMLANLFYNLSDQDLAAIIAYLKSLPPVDHELPKTRIGPLGRWQLLQVPDLIPAQVIDHDSPRPVAPQPGVTVEYGKYLATICHLCHGPNLSGGEGPGAGVNITPGGEVGGWSEADFIHTLRTGTTPNGKNLDPELMPWKVVGQMTDDELKAVWLYLQSVPAIQSTPTPAATP
jgi:mono/diheme cytochrome c family protein